jgi:hypothetical protein
MPEVSSPVVWINDRLFIIETMNPMAKVTQDSLRKAGLIDRKYRSK